MKKSLFAIAAVTAFAGAAQAQSSVTVYGFLDGGVGVTNIDYNTVSKQSQTAIGGFQNSNGTGNLSGSRLGFRGVEDLGSGNRAGFVLESGINYNNTTSPTVAATISDAGASTNGSALFASVRQAYISLGNKGFGELRIGTQNSLAKDTTEAFDPQGGPNLTGTGSLYQQGLVTRIGQAATYQSPTMSGFSVRAQTSVDGTASNNGGTNAATAVPTSNRASSASIDFTQGPIKVGGIYERRTTFYQAPGSATTSSIGGAGGAVNTMVAVGPSGTVAAVIPSINYYALGGSYDLKVVKPSVLYYNQSVNGANSSQSGTTSGVLLGATVPVTAQLALTASYTDGKVTNNNAGLYDTTGVQFVGTYALSKRTNAYAGYGQTEWKSNVLATTASVTYQMYTIGMRHSF
jgi:predicted porin